MSDSVVALAENSTKESNTSYSLDMIVNELADFAVGTFFEM